MDEDATTTGPPGDAPEPREAAAAGRRSATGEVPLCCADTVALHVRFNPMMVCSACKRIIKCFKEERAFQNYLTFCRTRRRPVLTGMVERHHTVVFNSYDTTMKR